MKKIGLIIISILLVFAISYSIINLSNKDIQQNVIANTENNEVASLPRVGSIENLKKMLKKANNNIYDLGYINFTTSLEMAVDDSLAMNSIGKPGTTEQSKAESHSETNRQEVGVDEGDIVKTDGKNIYQLTSNELVITKAFPAEEMKVIKKIRFSDGYRNARMNLNPMELYIDDEYITVIAQLYGRNYWYYGETEDLEKNENKDLIVAIVYDINTFEMVRKVEIEGNYVSSRKIGSAVYLVSNKYIYYRKDIKDDEIMPLYRDTIVNDEYKCVDVAEMCYFPNFEDNSCLLVAGFDIESNEEVQISSYLGACNEIYASQTSLYVTQPIYEKVSYLGEIVRDVMFGYYPEREVKTNIYKFAISNGKATYKGMGTVPGELLNQFSMNENGEYFRIATTTGNTWNETSENHLYVLNGKMQVVGSLEGLAKGERIYSTRFMGDKCYIVTYQYVDPLFVIDLSDNENPKVLGELKIPGYSDYLHPYKDNYLIGFGKDTIVEEYEMWDGSIEQTAYENGLKISLFDISDFENPKEIASKKIGDRGSYSELSYNHKALLFDEEKNIIAFPATVTESKETYSDGIPMYGETVFSGALVYGLDLEGEGFYLKGKITHTDENLNNKYYYGNNIERILYIDDTLYTTSDSMIKANDINTFEEINKVEI